MTTPADELRTAAATVRQLAEAATPGPWQQSGIGDYGWTVNTPDSHVAETDDSDLGRADANWIAAMGPNVGLALADWLDQEADRLAATATPLWQEAVGRHPLAIARALTGGQP